MRMQHISPALGGASARQRRMHRRARRLCFRDAVRLAADVSFGFTHRATHGTALWSDSVCVWLGNATFMYWSMREDHINIPRIVAETDGAPDREDALHEAVHGELTAYWADCLASLPPKRTPGWLPLP
jgi:hypothetical protein